MFFYIFFIFKPLFSGKLKVLYHSGCASSRDFEEAPAQLAIACVMRGVGCDCKLFDWVKIFCCLFKEDTTMISDAEQTIIVNLGDLVSDNHILKRMRIMKLIPKPKLPPKQEKLC